MAKKAGVNLFMTPHSFGDSRSCELEILYYTDGRFVVARATAASKRDLTRRYQAVFGWR